MEKVVWTFFVLAFAVSASAQQLTLQQAVDRQVALQEVSQAPGFTEAKEQGQERFLGPVNLLLTGGVIVASIADVESTFACIHETAFDHATNIVYGCQEGNWLQRPFVDRGKFATYGSKAVFAAAATVPAYYMRRSRSPMLRVAGYLLPVAVMFAQGRATVGNLHNRDVIRSHQ